MVLVGEQSYQLLRRDKRILILREIINELTDKSQAARKHVRFTGEAASTPKTIQHTHQSRQY